MIVTVKLRIWLCQKQPNQVKADMMSLALWMNLLEASVSNNIYQYRIILQRKKACREGESTGWKGSALKQEAAAAKGRLLELQ